MYPAFKVDPCARQMIFQQPFSMSGGLQPEFRGRVPKKFLEVQQLLEDAALPWCDVELHRL